MNTTTIRAVRAKLLVQSTLFAAVLAFLGTQAAHAAADTADTVSATGQNLDATGSYSLAALPNATDDVEFTGTYSPNLTFTISGAALTMGTLNDLDRTESLIISNTSATAGSITLGTAGTNSVSTTGTPAGSTADMLYLATGANLTIQSGTGVLTLDLTQSQNIDNNGTLTISAPISITAAKTVTFTGGGVTTISGVIANTTGAITINDGAGSVALSGANLYTGTTTLTGGTLDLKNQYALQNSVLSQSGGTLIFDSSVSGNAFNLGGLSGTQSINLANGATQAGSAIVLTLGNSTPTSASYTGALSGTGSLVKTGTNTQTLSELSLYANTFTGATTINSGILEYATTSSMSPYSAITVTPGGTLAIAVGGTNQFTNATSGPDSIGGILAGEGNSNGATPTPTINTVTFGQQTFLGIDTGSGSVTYAGNITNSGVGLNKLGSNSLILTGANTYTGNTLITAGTLQIGAGGTIGSLGTANVLDNGTLTFDRTDNYGGSIGNAIEGTGGVTVTAGTVKLTAANPFSGATTVAATTTLDLANSLALMDSNLSSLAGTLTFDSSVTSDAFTIGSYNNNTSLALANTSGSGITLTLGSIQNLSSSTSGVLSGAGGLTAFGWNNTVTLTGANSYTGTTTIDGATLNLGGSGTNGSINSSSALVLGGNGLGGTLAYTRTGTNTQSFSSTTIDSGENLITESLSTQTINLGALTHNAGGTIDFSSVGTIDTADTTNINGILGGYATYGNKSTWAVAPTTSGGAITGLANSAYTETGTALAVAANYLGENVDVNAGETFTSAIDPNSIRFSTTTNYVLNLVGLNNVQSGGILTTLTSGTSLGEAINGGALVGTPGGQLDLISNYGSASTTFTSTILNIGSLMEDNGAATAVVVAGSNVGKSVYVTNANNSFSGGFYLAGGGAATSQATGTPYGVGNIIFGNGSDYTGNSGGTLFITGTGTTSLGLLASASDGYSSGGNGNINNGGGVESVNLFGIGSATLYAAINSYSGGRVDNLVLNSGTEILGNSNAGSNLVTVNGGTLQIGTGDGIPLNPAGMAGFSNSSNNVQLAVGGGTFVELGNLAGFTTQAFNSGLAVNSGASTLTDNANGGAGTLVTLNNITRAVGGTVNFNLPSGTQTAVNGFTTTTLNTNGIIGGYATVGGTDWATNQTNTSGGNIVALAPSGYTSDTWAAGDNTDVTMDDAVTSATTNSLRFGAAGAGDTVTLNGVNTITSGGILVSSLAGSANEIIDDGGGSTLEGSSGGDLIINQFSTGTLTINASIADNGAATALTYSGPGELVLTGSDTYTGATYINNGTLATNSDGINAGSSTNGIFFNGGTLKVLAPDITGGSLTTAKALNIGVNGGTIDLAGNNASFSGNITGVTAEGVGAGAFGAFSPTGVGLFTITNSNSTAATLILGGTTDAYYGGMTVNGNTTVQDASTSTGIFSAGALTLGALGTPTVDLNGHNVTVAGLVGGTNGIVTNTNSAATSTMTWDGTISETYNGLIKDGAGKVAVTENLNNQTESETLTNANTYSGGTTITSGILYADNTSGSATGSGAVTVNTFAGTVSGTPSVNSGSTNGTLAGSGTVSGQVTLTSSSGTFTTANPYLSATLSSGGVQTSYATENSGNGQVNGTGTGGGLKLTNTAVNGLTIGGGSTLAFTLGSNVPSNFNPSAEFSILDPNTDSTYLTVNATGNIFSDTTTADIVSLTNLVVGSPTLALTLDKSGAYLLIETAGADAGTNADFSNLVTSGGEGQNGYVLGVDNGSGSYTAVSLEMFDIDGVSQTLPSNTSLYLENGELLVTAPEPSTWALLLGGVALLVTIQRRRRSSRL